MTEGKSDLTADLDMVACNDQAICPQDVNGRGRTKRGAVLAFGGANFATDAYVV